MDFLAPLFYRHFRTQRILGELIQEGQERGEIAKQNTGNLTGNNQFGSVPKENTSSIKTLSDIGITRKESSTFQQIADVALHN
jgi:hypothetical protein